MGLPQLSFRKRLTWGAHLFKAASRQRHTAITPLLDKSIPKDGVIIDAGAHARQFTQLFAQAVPQGHVYAFEAGSRARSAISKVVAVKSLKNVSVFPMGLSDKPSEETLRIPHTGCPVMGSRGKANEEEIILTTLDQFVAKHGLKRVDFIKAGIELRCLLGARQTLEKFRPVLSLEINDAFLQRAGNTAEELWRFLKELGYRIERIEGVGDIWRVP